MRPRQLDKRGWEQAGFVDQDGGLGGPLDLVPLAIPAVVELDSAGEGLIWPGTLESTQRRQVPGTHMLNEFVGLDGKPAESIRDYARRYGTLQLCEHWLPESHSWGAVAPDGDILATRLAAG